MTAAQQPVLDRNLLEKLVKQHVKDGVVDVIKLAKSLGLEVYPENLEDVNSGFLKKADDDSAFIVVNQNHPPTRQRFTVAHEISHFVEHKPALERTGQLDRTGLKNSDSSDDMESQADRLAAEILMPATLVTQYIDQLKDSFKSFGTDAIVEIANHYKVSPAMAVTRLRELGYHIPYVSFA